MITEEKFTAAMERAVDERGATWRYPLPEGASSRGYYTGGAPTYCDRAGNPTCLIGAVMHNLGMRLPDNDLLAPSALSVLGGYLSHKVVMAARCAQVHQDKYHTWGEALDVYRAALAIQNREEFTIFASMDLYREAVKVAAGTRTLDEVVRSTREVMDAFTELGKISAMTGTITGMAVGGFYAGTPSVATFGPNTMAALKKIPGATTITFTNPVYVPTVPTKAEHALIA